MPRRPQKSGQLKQKSLDSFFPHSSSPLVPTSSISSPPRSKNVSAAKKPAAMRKYGVAKRIPSADEDIPSAEDGGSSSSDPRKIRFESKAVTVSSSEEEVALSSPRVPTRSQTKKRRWMAESGEEGNDGIVTVSSDDEENIGVPVRWKGKATLTKRSRQVVESEEEGLPARRRKLVKGVRPPTPDEEEDLLAEVDESKIIDTRLRTRDKRSLYLQNLEKLKKKKSGEAAPSDPSESEEEEEEDYAEPFTDAKPDNIELSGSEDGEKELDSWIVDDGEAVAPELPPEFSMNTYQDLMHHFKIICQLFVHLAVQRRKDRRKFMEQSMKDQYFAVPLQIARRKLEGMRDSLITSSVWRPGYKKALGRFPELGTVLLDFVVPGCDACHLGGRMSKLVGRLSGDPYDRVTFKPLKRGSDSDDSDDEESSTPKIEFHLGRFCARRTRAYHRFTHWEYNLFKALSAEVEDLQNRQQGARVFVRVAYADGLKPPDDLTDADAIMNWLDERGVIAIEWHNIKEMMESAQNLEIAMKRGDDD